MIKALSGLINRYRYSSGKYPRPTSPHDLRRFVTKARENGLIAQVYLVCLVIWLIWLIWLVSFNHKTRQTK